jgi:hypothetical protein
VRWPQPGRGTKPDEIPLGGAATNTALCERHRPTKDARPRRRTGPPLTADAEKRTRVLGLTISCTREHVLVNPMIACVIGFSAFFRKSPCPAGDLH